MLAEGEACYKILRVEDRKIVSHLKPATVEMFACPASGYPAFARRSA